MLFCLSFRRSEMIKNLSLIPNKKCMTIKLTLLWRHMFKLLPIKQLWFDRICCITWTLRDIRKWITDEFWWLLSSEWAWSYITNLLAALHETLNSEKLGVEESWINDFRERVCSLVVWVMLLLRIFYLYTELYQNAHFRNFCCITCILRDIEETSDEKRRV